MLLAGRLFQGLRGSLSGADQKPVLSLECAGSEHPQPAKSASNLHTSEDGKVFNNIVPHHVSEINVCGYTKCVEPLAEWQPIS